MFIPGATDLADIAAVPVRKQYRPMQALPVGVEPQPSVHRNGSLFEALTAALDHVQSRRYGAEHDITLTPFLRHLIEVEFDKAIAAAFDTHSSVTSSSVDITTAPLDPEDTTFPLYRCSHTGAWTMVVRDARIRVTPHGGGEAHAVQVDFLKVELVSGLPRA